MKQCDSFIITDEEAKFYLSLGNKAFVYAQKLAKEYGVSDSISECQLIDCGGFYRLYVAY